MIVLGGAEPRPAGGGAGPLQEHSPWRTLVARPNIEQPAVRYFFDWPPRLRPAEIAGLIEELRVVRPLFIVDTFSADYRYTVTDIDTRPDAFLALLDEQYEYVGTMHFADVYRRIDP
jgi:hypothetical protein